MSCLRLLGKQTYVLTGLANQCQVSAWWGSRRAVRARTTASCLCFLGKQTCCHGSLDSVMSPLAGEAEVLTRSRDSVMFPLDGEADVLSGLARHISACWGSRRANRARGTATCLRLLGKADVLTDLARQCRVSA